MLEYAEAHGWDDFTMDSVIEFGTDTFVTTFSFVLDLIKKVTGEVGEAKDQMEKKGQEPKLITSKAIEDTLKNVETIVHPPTKVEVPQPTTQPAAKAEISASTSRKVSADLKELVARAEAAIAGMPYSGDSEHQPVDEPRTTTSELANSDSQIYTSNLPIDFEAPPGFLSSKKARIEPAAETEKKEDIKLVTLPLLTPTVSSLQSEPLISHLTRIIDDLIPHLQSDPVIASKAADVLESANKDLKYLVDQFEKTRDDERIALEAKLDEQSHEYSLKLLELELEARDKLDDQQEDFRRVFEEERAKIIQAYREKLENELKTQTELINERCVCFISIARKKLTQVFQYTRLKEEVIAQGIELQRRWIRDIKVRVEHERGGRLAKLDELSADLKRLERVTLDNASYLDDNIRVHALLSAIRALDSVTQSPVRKPFREELRVLRHITAAREDPVVTVALDSLEQTDVPDVGIEPFADLSTWFINEVSPKVSEVALIPNEDAGVLSYLASRTLSSLRFKPHGLVAGDDVLSVLARAEYYLNEKDLDSAARELNQLKGTAKVMLHDWLEAARRRLEVQQALEVTPLPY